MNRSRPSTAAKPQLDLYGVSSRPNDYLWLSVLDDIVRSSPEIECRVMCMCKIREYKKSKEEELTGRKITNFLTSHKSLQFVHGQTFDMLTDLCTRHPNWVYATDTHVNGDKHQMLAHHIMDVLKDIIDAVNTEAAKKRAMPDDGF